MFNSNIKHFSHFLSDNILMINSDCLEVFPHIKDKSIDAIICDLPYGVTRNKNDKIIPFDKLWEGYERIIKDNGAIILFGQGLFFVDLINSNRKLFRYDLVWNKILSTGFLNANRMPLRMHENIAVFYKKQPTYNPQFEIGKPNHSKGKRHKEKEPTNNNYGKFTSTENISLGNKKYPKSIIPIQKPHPSISKHRTQKPISLLEYLIKTYTNENDIILDNAMGSGTTCIASFNTKRKCIGIEKDKIEFKNAVSFFKENTYKLT